MSGQRETPRQRAERHGFSVVLARAEEETRLATIRECVTWLAMNHAEWKSHALAGEMATDLLPKNPAEKPA